MVYPVKESSDVSFYNPAFSTRVQFLGYTGELWISQVPDVSLPTCHALRPRRSHRTLAILHPCCWLPWLLTRRPPVGLLTRLNCFGEVILPCGL